MNLSREGDHSDYFKSHDLKDQRLWMVWSTLFLIDNKIKSNLKWMDTNLLLLLLLLLLLMLSSSSSSSCFCFNILMLVLLYDDTIVQQQQHFYFSKSTLFFPDNWVLSTGLIMWIGHRKEIWKLAFRALALRRSESRYDEGLTLETPAFESLYGGQFTLSTQLIKPNYLVILPTEAASQFL